MLEPTSKKIQSMEEAAKNLLYQAIIAKNELRAMRAIQFIEDNFTFVSTEGISSNSVLNDITTGIYEGKTFLEHALQNCLFGVFEKILNQSNKSQALLISDIKKCSILMTTVLIDSYDHIVMLTRLARNQADIDYFNWLTKSDIYGNTVFHLAAKIANFNSFLFLINEIKDEEILLELVNQYNLNDETPLHCAYKSLINLSHIHARDSKPNYTNYIKIIAKCIELGTDFYLLNEKDKSPFSLHCKLPQEIQIQILRKMSEDQQQNCLAAYRKFNPKLFEEIGQHWSLQLKMLIQHEKKLSKKEFASIEYQQTIKEIESRVEFWQPVRNGRYYSVYKDKEQLSNLMNLISNLLTELATDQTYILSNRILVITLPSLIVAMAVTLFIYTYQSINPHLEEARSAYQQFLKSAGNDTDMLIKSHDGRISAKLCVLELMVVFLVGFLSTSFVARTLHRKLWNLPPLIPPSRWDIIHSQATVLLSKLHDIELDGLPMETLESTTITGLETELQNLSQAQPLPRAMQILTNLNRHIESIRSYLTLINRPLFINNEHTEEAEIHIEMGLPTEETTNFPDELDLIEETSLAKSDKIKVL